LFHFLSLIDCVFFPWTEGIMKTQLCLTCFTEWYKTENQNASEKNVSSEA